jgi:peptide/nickel transport system permease protein
MKMRDYIIRRLILLIPVVFGISIITFVLSHIIGDPVAAYVTERTTEAQILLLIKQHHLDEPILNQYLYYIVDLFRGDWGYSRAQHMPALECIFQFFPATFELSLVAIIFTLGLGIPIGVISAVKKDKPIDHGTRLFALAGVSMPVFWFALILLFFFYYQLHINGLPYFPQGGRLGTFAGLDYPITQITGLFILDSILTLNLPMFLDALWHIFLPAFCLSLVNMALVVRMMRSSMLEVMRQDYITMARSKGLSERVVIYKHALRNAMIPTLTVGGLIFGGLLSGAVLTESIFSWPGMGRWATASIVTGDFGGIQAFVLVVGIIYVIVNLIVDLLYGVMDPRIRYG